MATSPEPVSILDQHLLNLNGEVFMTVSTLLTATRGIGGRSWEGVAGKLGLNALQVDLLIQHIESNKGWLLLTTWGKMETGATVRKLIIALESLKMRECIYALQEAASISDDNIESAMNQCAELVKTGRFCSHFPNYNITQFSEALYSHLHKDYHARHPPLPPQIQVHSGFSESSTMQEDLPQTVQDAPAEPERPQLVQESVFISYCPEDDEAGLKLDNKLRYLAETLNEYGYTIYYDKYCMEDVRKCGGVDLWKERHIRKSENILVICTPEYFQDDDMALMENKDSKIAVDRKLLRTIAYSNSQDRLIPVLLDVYKNVRRNCIPSFVQASQLHFWPSKKEDLMFYLAKQSKYKLPEVLEKKVVKPIMIQVPPRRPKVVQQRIQPQPTMREKKVVKPCIVEVPQTREPPRTQSKSSKSHDKKGRKLFGNFFSRTNNGQK